MGRGCLKVNLRACLAELGEIEALLDAHSEALCSVSIAREDAPGDQRLVAYVTPAAGSGVPVAALREYLRAKLPEFMVPAHFVAMCELPLTPSLKIDRKALPPPGAMTEIGRASCRERGW